MKANKINYTLRILKGRKIIQTYRSFKIRRFKNYIASINWQNCDFRVYLKVSYGSEFHNSGVYKTKEDLLFALDTFADPAIAKYLYGE